MTFLSSRQLLDTNYKVYVLSLVTSRYSCVCWLFFLPISIYMYLPVGECVTTTVIWFFHVHSPFHNFYTCSPLSTFAEYRQTDSLFSAYSSFAVPPRPTTRPVAESMSADGELSPRRRSQPITRRQLLKVGRKGDSKWKDVVRLLPYAKGNNGLAFSREDIKAYVLAEDDGEGCLIAALSDWCNLDKRTHNAGVLWDVLSQAGLRSIAEEVLNAST